MGILVELEQYSYQLKQFVIKTAVIPGQTNTGKNCNIFFS